VTDSVSLESYLRIHHIAKIVDLSSKDNMTDLDEYLKEFSKFEKLIAVHFGNKFCFKFQAITKEYTQYQIKSDSKELRCLTLPQSLWPIGVQSNIPKVLPDLSKFESVYQQKFAKRKLKYPINWLG